MTDTPPSGDDDDLLGAAAPAPAARQHRSHSSRHRKRGLRPIDIAGIVVAVIVVVGVVIVIAKGHKSTTSTAATTTTVSTKSTTGGTTAKTGAVTWVYTGLDGKTITVAKGTSGSARFVTVSGKAIPLTVAAIDKALAKNDCAATEKIYTANKAANPKSTAKSNARRSAFAHYAVVQSTAKGCAWAKAIPPTP